MVKQITFNQLKRHIRNEYVGNFATSDREKEEVAEIKESGRDILNTTNLDELVGVLEGLGFGHTEPYEFIIDALVKRKRDSET